MISLQSVFVLDTEGKVVGGNGPPGLAFNPTSARSMTGKPILTLDQGRMPDGPKQVALDVDTADQAGYEIGDTVPLVTGATTPQSQAQLSGRVELGAGGDRKSD